MAHELIDATQGTQDVSELTGEKETTERTHQTLEPFTTQCRDNDDDDTAARAAERGSPA